VFTNGIEKNFGKEILKLLGDFSIFEEIKEINKAIDKKFTVHVKRLQEPAAFLLGGLLLKYLLQGLLRM